MKKIALVLVVALMFVAVLPVPGSAWSFGGLLEDATELWEDVTGYFGFGDDETQEGDFPDLSGEFTGPLIDVEIAGYTIEVHESFKLAMDQYEAFFDAYIEALTTDDYLAYAQLLTLYVPAMEALETIDETELSDGDFEYYTLVMLRISEKLLLAAEME